jgi:hypothetical protein
MMTMIANVSKMEKYAKKGDGEGRKPRPFVFVGFTGVLD